MALCTLARGLEGRSPEPPTMRGGDFVDYYLQRRVEQIRRESGDQQAEWATHETGGSGRSHSWRRSAGTVLARLERKGVVYVYDRPHHISEYKLTDAGKRALDT